MEMGTGGGTGLYTTTLHHPFFTGGLLTTLNDKTIQHCADTPCIHTYTSRCLAKILFLFAGLVLPI